MPELRISPEKVCFVIIKAREFDVKVAPSELDDGSNPTDDGELIVLEDYADDPTFEELNAFLVAQSTEELEDLLALMWVGQGDYSVEEWDDALDAAADVPRRRIPHQLLSTPLLGDFLEEGLAQFGLSCEDFEGAHP